ncbi:unnamed protein product [Penicillium olsonii]|nr:unnamed protein product [Penicillium olsonii]
METHLTTKKMADSTPETLYEIGWRIKDQCVNVKQLVEDENDQNLAVLNELQRFEVWAINLGLYHRGHSSFDYRCRDSPRIFSYALCLLHDLDRELQQFQSSLPQLHEEIDDPEHGTLPDRESPPVSDDSDSEDFSSYQMESLSEAFLVNIQSTIDRLYNLAFKIRNPAMRIGLSKATTYSEIDPETKMDLIKEFEQRDLRHVEEIFRSFGHPDLSPSQYLIKRLARANTRRRQQFRYWNKRRANYAVAERPHQMKNPKPSLERPLQSQSERTVLQPTSESLKASTATWLDDRKVNLDDDVSVITSSSTVFSMSTERDGDKAAIPPPPMVNASVKEFECPLCCIICPRKTLKQKAWQPYICTYEDCRDPDQQYDSLHDWIGHEVSNHQPESQSNMSPAPFQTRDCPFCQCHNVSVSHIAGHLRRIACFALPRSPAHDGSLGSADEVSQGAQVDSDSSGSLLIGSVHDDQREMGDMERMSDLEENPQGQDHISNLEVADDHETLSRFLTASLGGGKSAQLVQILLDHGANTNTKGGLYGTALQAASLNGHIEIVQILLEYGADVDTQNLLFRDALQAASLNGHREIVQILLDHGANVNAQGGGYGNALQAACVRGHTEIVRILIDHGADVNTQSGQYGNPLQAASVNGHTEIAQILIDYGANVNAQGGGYGNALQVASENGYAELAQILIDHGANVNAQVGEYGNALHAASVKGHTEIAQILLEHGADANAQGGEYGNALHAASVKGHTEIAKILLEHGADANAQDGNHGNASQVASVNGHTKAVQLPYVPPRLEDLTLNPPAQLERTDSSHTSEEAIQSAQRAVDTTPEDHPDLPRRLNDLANILFARYERVGDIGTLEEGIQVAQRAVDTTPRDHPDLPRRLNDLANILFARYERVGDIGTLEEGIQVAQRAVDTTPRDHPDLPGDLKYLVTMLFERYRQTGTEIDPGCLNDLANVLFERYQRTRADIDLEEAIQFAQRAVDATPEDHPGLPSRLNGLGKMLFARSQLSGAEIDLDEAIEFAQKAVDAIPEDYPSKPSRFYGLAKMLFVRSQRTGAEIDLEEAIRFAQRAIDTTPEDLPDHPVYLNHLANMLFERSQRTGAKIDLEEAIQLAQKAVDNTPEDHPRLPPRLNSLENMLSTRDDRIKDLG